ncbi:hypothetical protein Sme01_69270 [Sphaerisporangium melleum]|uniref:Uncharacterized protein n=1 Tax=Sphaerisporangium melleum TaxID=321316 RepID=A0A917RLF5_9ACTN|nr:hypothetical protein [Sphaerisporangium melleum]GGL12552.1 hypothetical protein GCM10007964_63260 [Sphaerisporangium melleum]GII74451.1 hypothetical protein Sme01_69270 [Sphaerisporangium melleum]
MSTDPTRPEGGPRVPGERRSPMRDATSPGGPPPLYVRVVNLCRLLGEERFFRAAFDDAGVHPREAAAGERTRVLEIDVEEVVRAALGAHGAEAAPPRRG